MSGSMLKWRARRKYSLLETPYERLDESYDVTKSGNMTRIIKNEDLRNIRSSETSKDNARWLPRRAIRNADSDQSYETPKNETDDFELSFAKISSRELSLKESDTDLQVFKKENKQPEPLRRNAIRRFSDSSIASVVKMSAKLSKIKGSFVPSRKSSRTLSEVVENSCKRPKRETAMNDAVVPASNKNSCQCTECANRSRSRRWSLLPTNYVKLNNSDSSPNMTFGLEDVAHSTFIHERMDGKTGKTSFGKKLEGSTLPYHEHAGGKIVANKSPGSISKHSVNFINKQVGKKTGLPRNNRRVRKVKKLGVRSSACAKTTNEKNISNIKTKRFKGNVGTTKFSKGMRKDSYNLRTFSVKSSGGKVEVKISLELTDAQKEKKKSCVTNEHYLKSPLQPLDSTPMLRKRNLSRRSLFCDTPSNVKTTVGVTETVGNDESSSSDMIVPRLNATPGLQENSVLLSPYMGEIAEEHLITPTNTKQFIVSVSQLDRARRHVRKKTSVTY